MLGYRSVDVSAKFLAVIMSAEISILAVLDLGIIWHRGAAALPGSVFAPSTVFSGALGLALMFAFASFIGFESAALYGEESQDPHTARLGPREAPGHRCKEGGRRSHRRGR